MAHALKSNFDNMNKNMSHLKSLEDVATRKSIFRTCPHRKLRTSFRRILSMSALKKYTIRQDAFAFSSCPRQNHARTSAHDLYVDRFSKS